MGVRLRLENVDTTVLDATRRERAWLYEHLSIEKRNHRFSEFVDPNEDTSERLFVDGRFPSGLLPIVRSEAPRRGFPVEVYDMRERPGPSTREALAAADLEWLKTRKLGPNRDGRPFQFHLVKDMLRYGRGICHAPTGAGKGEVAVGVAKAMPVRWLFLVHRTILRDDVARRWVLRGDGSPPAFLGGEHGWKPGERLTLATFASVARNLDDPRVLHCLKQFDGVIVDECHSSAAASHTKVLARMPNAYFRLGLSGTSLARSDGRNLRVIASMGPIVARVESQELMEAGYVATATVHLHECRQTGSGKWHNLARKLIDESKARNSILVRQAVACQKPAMLFVDRVRQGKAVLDMLRARGVESEFVWGKTWDAERERCVNALKKGQIDVLVCNAVFREGVDVPDLRSVVYGAGGKSVIALIQSVGRGSRVTEDKQSFAIYDVLDVGQRTLEAHSQARVRTYREYGYKVREYL